jgi:hypothetical protein
MPDNNSEDKKPLTRPHISPTKIVWQQEKCPPTSCRSLPPAAIQNGRVRDVLEQAMRLKKIWNTPAAQSW